MGNMMKRTGFWARTFQTNPCLFRQTGTTCSETRLPDQPRLCAILLSRLRVVDPIVKNHRS